MAQFKKKVDAKKTKDYNEAVVKISPEGNVEVTYESQAMLVRSQPSVTIKNDGKGRIQVEMKSYADTLDEAVKIILKQYKKISKELNLDGDDE